LEIQINPSCHASANGGERDLPGAVLHPCHSQLDGMFQEKLAQYLDFLKFDPGANIIKKKDKFKTLSSSMIILCRVTQVIMMSLSVSISQN
jgi:hypothetical protein